MISFFKLIGHRTKLEYDLVKVDTSVRVHDDFLPAQPGETYCYLDSYRIDKDSLEMKP